MVEQETENLCVAGSIPAPGTIAVLTMTLINNLIDAMDTSSSCFVFASAGSGKTKVLVDRFIKHMFCGCRARDIMCVTFTKAAAFEMKSRIESALQKLETTDEDSLVKYLHDDLRIDSSNIERARQLYAEWINEYSLLNITTVHSFCQKLLEQYPIEAGVIPDFNILDDLEYAELFEEAKEKFFQKIMHTDDTSVRDLAKVVSDSSFENLLNDMFISLPKFRRFIRQNKDIEEYERKLNEIFNVGKQRVTPPGMSEDMFLTQTGEIRKKIKNPSDIAIAEIFYNNRNNRNRQSTISKTINFIKIAVQILDEYQLLKNERNVLDFTDIIYQTEFLLKQSAAAGFVISQISKSVKHIMIDEAQDLNADQWQIISLIFDEIFINSAEGNTIFVVGDVKQSIYGFQDANPDNFINFYHKCQNVLPKVGKRLQKADLQKCYRCAPQLLNLIDKTFVNVMEDYKKHISFRSDNGKYEFISIEDVPDCVKTLINNEDIRPSDIMVLTKNRNAVSDLLLEIQERELPTCGLDKINLNDSLIVMDIIALAEICMDHTNNYAMTCVSRSPNILNFVSDDLIAKFKRCDLVEFFYYLSTQILRIRSYYEREILASFMNIVIKRSEKYNESISDFVIWFKSNKVQFQRELTRRDGVIFSTIHGSKGLESPVVILMDFSLEPDRNKIKFIWSFDEQNIIFIVKPKSTESFPELRPMMESCYQNEKSENLRLLYVALTRARNELYLVSSGKKGGIFDFICEKLYGN